MSEREIKNAQIEGTMLGTEDHGILSSYLYLKYDGTGQGFGGYCFDTPIDIRKPSFRREGVAWGMEFIRRVLITVGVTRWEDLIGKHIRADSEFGKVHGIGHIIENRWFYPEEDLKHLLQEEPNEPDSEA